MEIIGIFLLFHLPSLRRISIFCAFSRICCFTVDAPFPLSAHSLSVGPNKEVRLIQIILFTALSVGGATVVGAIIGFVFKNRSFGEGNVILSFAAGVMLAASIVGLILPALSQSTDKGILPILLCFAGLLLGALFMTLAEGLVPFFYSKIPNAAEGRHIRRALLLVLAIALHNLPEGIAAGVSFGTGDVSHAFSVAGGIAIQNIPEGMVIIAPLLGVGISRRHTLLIALLTAVIEIVGTFLGYFALQISAALLPFILALAGGSMLYVITDSMIPDLHTEEHAHSPTYSLLIGFSVMLLLDLLL